MQLFNLNNRAILEKTIYKYELFNFFFWGLEFLKDSLIFNIKFMCTTIKS